MSTYPVVKLLLSDGILEFSKDEILRASLVEEVDPISVELPISTFEFDVIQYDDSFSMFDGNLYQQLSERLPILVYENINGADYLIGKFYLDEWENISEREFRFKAVNVIGVLEKMEFDGIFFSTPTNFSTILAQTLGAININYILSESLKDFKVAGWIPPGNYRAALQQICFAGGACAITARTQNLLIEPIKFSDATLSNYNFKEITEDMKLMEQSIKLLPLITSIELITHDYVAGTQQETVFEKELEAGSYKIVFQKPLFNLTVDGPGYAAAVLGTEAGDYLVTENGDYIEMGGEYNFGPNVLFLTLSEAGLVTVTGYPWVDNQQSFFHVSEQPGETNKINLKIENATLMSSENVQSALQRLSTYYNQRYENRIKLLPTTVKVNDSILTSSLYHNYLLGNIERLTSDLAGGFLLDVSSVSINVSKISSRAARCGVAISGSNLTRQNLFRKSVFMIRRK